MSPTTSFEVDAARHTIIELGEFPSSLREMTRGRLIERLVVIIVSQHVIIGDGVKHAKAHGVKPKQGLDLCKQFHYRWWSRPADSVLEQSIRCLVE